MSSMFYLHLSRVKYCNPSPNAGVRFLEKAAVGKSAAGEVQGQAKWRFNTIKMDCDGIADHADISQSKKGACHVTLHSSIELLSPWIEWQ